jgi:hypothetical protein
MALPHPARIGRLVLVSTSAAGRGAVTVADHGSCVSIRRRSRDLRSGRMRRWGQDRGLRLFARLHLVMIWVLTGCSGWAAATRSMRYLSFIRLCSGLVLLSRLPASRNAGLLMLRHDDPGCLQRLGAPHCPATGPAAWGAAASKNQQAGRSVLGGDSACPRGLSAQDGARRGEPLLPQAVPARASCARRGLLRRPPVRAGPRMGTAWPSRQRFSAPGGQALITVT